VEIAMRQVDAVLESTACYSQSRAYEAEKLEREGHEDYEKRTWRERCHVDENGELFIPPTAFKNCLAQAVLFTPRKGPGGGASTWTKNFEAGVMCTEKLSIGIKKESVACERLFVPSDGKRGGGKRVWKYFPLIAKWSGTVKFLILDDSITESVFRAYLEEAGMFIGIGRFRPRNNGFYGRFKVVSVKWSERE
jgi:hypothetical protein